MLDNESNHSDTAPVIDAIERLAQIEDFILDPNADDVRVLAVPNGKAIKSIKPFLDEYLKAPERRRGTARLTTLLSFIEHINRFKDEHSAVFADVANPAAPRLIGVLNYNEKAAGPPRFGDHRAEYPFPISEEWKAWTGKKDVMGLADFAEFLEEHVGDIVDPATLPKESPTLAEAKQLGITLATPQALMETSRGLTVHVKAGITNATRLSSGETQVDFKEEHQGADGKALVVPGGFAIAIPVFRLGTPYLLLVRLRYRVEGNKVLWFFAISKVAKSFETAITKVCDQAAADTALPLFYGTPEQG
jgi:uncharacterized protein YfdQ (DUF2303 family)